MSAEVVATVFTIGPDCTCRNRLSRTCPGVPRCTQALPRTTPRVPTDLQASTDVGGPARVECLAALPDRVEELIARWG